MTAKRYGDPVLTLRMPRAVINALKIEAAKQGCTVSDILRELAEEELTSKGYRFTDETLEGQQSFV